MTDPLMKARRHRPRSILIALLIGAGLVATVSAASAVQNSGFHTNDVTRNGLGRVDGDVFISRDAAAEDLDTLAEAIRDNSSYIWASTFPYAQVIEDMKTALPAKVSVNGLSTQINKLVRLFGDDHAQVVGWTDRIPQGTAPFQLGKVDARYFLYSASPAGFVDPEFPYVRAMDDVLIDEWVRAAGDIGQGPHSATAARFSKGRSVFSYIDYLRMEMGLPVKPEVELELVCEDGQRSARRRVAVLPSPQPSSAKTFDLPADSRMLEGNVGYLRVPAHRGDLEARFLASLQDNMSEFRDTDALIIDARQSGGGARRALNALFPYFMAADAAPYVFNVVKLRIPATAVDFNAASMFDTPSKRFWYVPNPAVPTDEAEAYRQFAERFQPTWQPPADQFTDWYFMSLRPDPAKPHYTKPVYLLIDWGIGSAGDIFTSAFNGWNNVTLIGTPTMGRSGQGVVFPLPNSGLGVNLSTMASFQKTGERYDTVGIAPDIVMEPDPVDWFSASDSMLKRAQAMLADELARQAVAR